MDLQLVFPIYVSNSIREISTRKIISKSGGFDDITIRMKYNIWGNKGGRTALSILPFLSFPTSSFSRNGIQGGIIFPFASKIREGLDFGSQAGINIVKQEDNKYTFELLYTATFGKSLFTKVDGFAEAFTTYSSYTNIADLYVDGGIIYSISKNLNIDAGVNIGLNKGSDKIYFLGFSFRY